MPGRQQKFDIFGGSIVTLAAVSRQAHGRLSHDGRVREPKSKARAPSTWLGSTGGRKRNFTGQHSWARGYFVSTVGRNEEAIREYIRRQEKEDARLEQLNLWR